MSDETSRSRTPGAPFDFGLTRRYDPPLRLTPPAPLEVGARKAFTAFLPHPPNGDTEDEAFFYRLPDGRVVGYFNRCTHIRAPLDFGDGEFLDAAGFILCRLHGARYDLESGEVCYGPARTHLTRVLCEEEAGALIVYGWEKVRPPRPFAD